MLHNLRKKIVVIFLSCFLVISSTVSSFAFAPVVALAPEVFSLIATTLVCAGVKFADYKALNRSVRDVYETEGFITKCLPQLEQDIKNAHDGVVTLSKNVIDFFQDTFFPKVLKGENIIFSDIPCVRLPVSSYNKFFSDKYDNANLISSPVFNIKRSEFFSQKIGNFEVRHEANTDFVHFYMSGKVLSWCDISMPSYRGKVSLLYHISDSQPWIQPVIFSSYWWCSGQNLLDAYSENTYLWGNSGGLPYLDVPVEGTLDIPVANDVSDLLNQDVWNPAPEQVWSPSMPIQIPVVAEGDLVQEGDYIIPPSPTPPDPDPPDPDNPDPDNPDPEKPPFYVPEQDGIDFTPIINLSLKFTEKFPFSLAWDFKRIFDFFDVPPKAPTWTVPIITERVTIDLTKFSAFADITKFFTYISFCICLIFIFNKIKS